METFGQRAWLGQETGQNKGQEIGLLISSFTAQPEAPACMKAGASGWAVNENT